LITGGVFVSEKQSRDGQKRIDTKTADLFRAYNKKIRDDKNKRRAESTG